MTFKDHSSRGGAEATRIEMTRPEKNTGRTIWKFYAIIFLALVVALAVILGIMRHESAGKLEVSPTAGPSETADTENPPEPRVGDPASEPDQETAPPVPSAEPDPAIVFFPENQVAPEIKTAQADPDSRSVRIGDIYQDEDGVWRNRPPLVADPTSSEFYQDESGVWHNRQLPPSRSASGRSNSSLSASLPPGLMDMLSIGSSVEGSDLSGLLSPGALNALGGGDWLNSGSLEALSGLLNSAGGLDSSGLGELLGGASGMDTGDISGLVNMLDAVLGGQSGLTGDVFSGQDTAPPQANVISSSPTLWGQPSSASQPTSATGDSVFRLDGYEQFDPATAGKIESDWDFFVAD